MHTLSRDSADERRRGGPRVHAPHAPQQLSAAAAAAYALIAPYQEGALSDVPWHIRARSSNPPPQQHQQQQRLGPSRPTAGCWQRGPGGSAIAPIVLGDSGDECDDASASDFASDDDAASESEHESEPEAEQSEAPAGRRSRKLWTNAQFPDGYSAGFISSMSNLVAAQEWSCPCPDRRNCIGAERLDIFKLYEFRREFRQRSVRSSMRDAMRMELQTHYDERMGTFTRSFVVGPCGDCCAASAALARGLSSNNFFLARADLRQGRPLHSERVAARQALLTLP